MTLSVDLAERKCQYREFNKKANTLTDIDMIVREMRGRYCGVDERALARLPDEKPTKQFHVLARVFGADDKLGDEARGPRHARQDDGLDAIVVRVDEGGGVVTPPSRAYAHHRVQKHNVHDHERLGGVNLHHSNLGRWLAVRFHLLCTTAGVTCQFVSLGGDKH